MMETGHFEKFESYIPIDLGSLQGFFLAMAVMGAFIIGRYFLFVLPFYWTFWLRGKPSSSAVHDQKIKPDQVRFEIRHSMVASLIFAFSGYLMGLEWQLGWSRFYLRFDEFPYWYLVASFVLISVLHEIYFYLTHRWMHIPKIYRWLHAVHHYSRKTTPWASFSFHPGEAVIQAAFLPLLVFVVPVHPTVVISYLTFMTVTAISNHLGVELVGPEWLRSWFISGTHHSLHHEKFNGNYGLYFRFLDQILGTEIKTETKRAPIQTLASEGT